MCKQQYEHFYLLEFFMALESVVQWLNLLAACCITSLMMFTYRINCLRDGITYTMDGWDDCVGFNSLDGAEW